MFNKISSAYQNNWYTIVNSMISTGVSIVVSTIVAIFCRLQGWSGFWTIFWSILVLLTFLRSARWAFSHRRSSKQARQSRLNMTLTSEPPYIPYESLHPVTKQFSGLSYEELQQVYIDEPHHWVVTFAMIFVNPFWGRDNDVQPDMSPILREKLASKTDERLVSLLRFFVGIARIIFYCVFGLALACLMAKLFVPVLAQWVPAWVPAALLLLAAAMIVPWALYMRGVAQSCRLVMTKRQIRLVVHQLPWRSNTPASVPQRVYNMSVFDKPVLGRLLGFANIIIRTTEQEETLPAWIRARNADGIRRVFRYWEEQHYCQEHPEEASKAEAGK